MVMKLNKMVFDDKKIEEAARGAADLYEQDLPMMSYDEDTEVDGQHHFCQEFGAELFKDGAKWAINEFSKDWWHDIDENPKKYHKCLVEVVYHRPLNMTDEIDYVTSHLTKFGWDESSFKRSDYTIKRWIYIDDLLKGCNHD